MLPESCHRLLRSTVPTSLSVAMRVGKAKFEAYVHAMGLTWAEVTEEMAAMPIPEALSYLASVEAFKRKFLYGKTTIRLKVHRAKLATALAKKSYSIDELLPVLSGLPAAAVDDAVLEEKKLEAFVSSAISKMGTEKAGLPIAKAKLRANLAPQLQVRAID